jgi:signal transduction histidine kinase
MTGEDLDLEKVTKGWKQKMERALNGGYAGLRLSADTAWLEKRHWKEFSQYEKEVNDSIADAPMLALCTYPLRGSAAAEILDVTRTHQFAIARRNHGWEVVETSELKQAKTEILRLNDDLERRVVERTRQLTVTNEELRRQMGERRRAEEALRELSGQLLRLQDEERRRLARELHDSTGQKLAALAMNLSMVDQSAAVADVRSQRALSESVALTGECLREIRTLAYLLHPPELEELGLADAARNYINGFAQRSGISVVLKLSADLGRLPREVETTLFRILQESLNNVHRHSGSPKVRVHIYRSPASITMKVQDEG